LVVEEEEHVHISGLSPDSQDDGVEIVNGKIHSISEREKKLIESSGLDILLGKQVNEDNI
jgi:hypothetical protein